jgi:hypothetical protein
VNIGIRLKTISDIRLVAGLRAKELGKQLLTFDHKDESHIQSTQMSTIIALK